MRSGYHQSQTLEVRRRGLLSAKDERDRWPWHPPFIDEQISKMGDFGMKITRIAVLFTPSILYRLYGKINYRQEKSTQAICRVGVDLLRLLQIWSAFSMYRVIRHVYRLRITLFMAFNSILEYIGDMPLTNLELYSMKSVFFD
jgi:hypothetical protein